MPGQEEKESNQARGGTTMNNLTDGVAYKQTFLSKNVSYIVYWIFLIGLLLNSVMALLYFKSGLIFLGIWAVLAIFMLPKCVLALLLIIGYKSIDPPSDLSRIIYSVYPRTILRYDSMVLLVRGGRIGGILKQIFWLAIALGPLIRFLFAGTRIIKFVF